LRGALTKPSRSGYTKFFGEPGGTTGGRDRKLEVCWWADHFKGGPPRNWCVVVSPFGGRPGSAWELD